jgi:hypothetical protein
VPFAVRDLEHHLATSAGVSSVKPGTRLSGPASEAANQRGQLLEDSLRGVWLSLSESCGRSLR